MVVVVAEADGVGGAAADGAVVPVVGSGDIGIGDGAAHNVAYEVVAHDAADVLVACDAGIGEVDVVDVGTAVYTAEEALVDVGSAADGLADADAADGVVRAVELAFEVAHGAADVGAYGLIVLVVVVALVVGVGERDVGSELEVLVLVAVFNGGLAVGAVHAVGEQQELVFVVYHVGVFRVALVHGCPVDGGEGGGVDADGHVLVGHGEGGAAEGACAGGVAVVAVAEGCAGGGVAEGEAELVAAAVVEGLAELQASAAVGGDAADGVLGRRAGEGDGLDGDVVGGGDGAGGLALRGAERAGVVAVADGGRGATVEGAAGVIVDVACQHLGLAMLSVDVGGGVEAVADGAVAPSNEAGAVGGGVIAGVLAEQLAVEHAARDGARAVDYGDDAAVGAVAAGGAVDGDAADAVGDGGRALHDAYESGGVLAVGADGAAGGASADGQRAAVTGRCLADERGGIEVVGVAGAHGAADVDRGVAAADVDVAPLQGDESGHVAVVIGGDGGHHVEVADGRGIVGCGAALDADEGGAVVVGGVGGERQRIAAAVEVAAEGVVAAARHAADGDVGVEADGLAAERFAVGDEVAEHAPARGGVDGVGVARLREVGGVDADGGGDSAVVVVGHGELAAGQCEAGGGEAGYVTRIGGGVEGDSLVGGGVDDAAANPAHSAAEGDVAVSTADGEGYGAGFGLAANCLLGIVIIITIPSAYADVVVIVGRGCRGASSACHLADVGIVIIRNLADTAIHQQAVGDGGVVVAPAHQAAEVELIRAVAAV
ncbi:MAG: hypothetical protein IKH35_05140 [Prevotella sp.]|nr:hypothetical protein [Prevotella sp.]